ncbi:MAG: myo-inositol-phosphate synthase [Candidatus Cloacimonadota bacterium]|jgi:myo-inositol-1-phosphate synthase|nr:myo-inositol-phosphate synthase [Candidatus Cloacimonadota bacterium]
MRKQLKQPPKKLGVLIPGLGAIGTSFIAGVELIKKKYAKPIGSMTQMGTIRLGKRTENRTPLIKDFVPLADINSLVFGGWDIFNETAYEAAKHAKVLTNEHIELVKDELQAIKPMKAVFNRRYVKKLDGPNVKKAGNKYELAQKLMEDIDNFKQENELDSVVMVWCASTEVYIEPQEVHQSLETFEKAMKENHDAISPSMIYAYAALKKGIPFANGAPNLTVDIPAIWELAKKNQVPIAGKDYKTGQTLMKTIISPGLKARLLGINGWFSTNILGNRDGEVLDDPESFKTKEVSKLGVLNYILQPEKNPDLYKDLYHKVRINYYPPRGDNKEGWDNIDIFGWLGYPMQIKIDFLCKDSILAAPIVLDLVLFMDLAQRVGFHGIQEWLSFYFKSPMHLPKLYPEHDLFVQLAKLKNTLRYIMGEDMITHLGLDYYDGQMRPED